MKYILLLLLSISAVAQTSNNISVISAEKLNVVYRGIDNPIKIAVPGAKSFTATALGLKQVDSLGNYELRPGSGNEVVVRIEAVMEDGSLLKEEKVFRVKGFPALTGIVHGKSTCGNYAFRKEELTNIQIDVVYEGVLLYEPNVDYRVHEFTITHIPKRGRKQKTVKITGNILTIEIIKELGEIKTGSIMIIDNIKTWNKVWHGLSKRPSPIVIEITE